MSQEEGTLDLSKWEELHEEGITILGATNIGMIKDVEVSDGHEEVEEEESEEDPAIIREVPSRSMMADFDPTHPDNENYGSHDVPAWTDVICHANSLDVQLGVIERQLCPANMAVLRRIRQLKNLVSKLQGDIARTEKEDKNKVLRSIFDDEL